MADKHRTEREFAVGDMVYLRLQPYRQISAGGRRPQKISPLFFGPHQILQKVGTVAYRLQLPEESRIHPVFHVSQLKKRLGETIQVQHQAPSELAEHILGPELITERRMVNKEGKATTEVLIKWKQLPLKEAT